MPLAAALPDVAREHACARASVWFRAARTRSAASMLLVALLASLNYLVGIGEPRHAVWDETYYLTSAQRYKDSTAQFASHPPLGLMLIAAGEALSGENRDIDTTRLGWDKKISGERLPERFSFQGERAASGMVAVAGAVVFFALMLALTRSQLAALLLTNLYLFENAFIVHFRAAQLDAFEVFFALCALLCFVKSFRSGGRNSFVLDFALGVSCGLATMVKLNAGVLALLGVMIVLWRAAGANDRSLGRRLALAVRDGGTMVAGGLLAIVTVMTVHVLHTRHPPDVRSPAGQQDNRFISATYRDYLQGERPISPTVVFAATRDYARFISSDFAGMARNDPNGSGPLQWLLNRKAINYRWDSDGSPETCYVQLTGNLFGWVLALAGLLAASGLLILQKVRPRAASQQDRRTLMAMLVIQYLAFMALHLWLGTQRVLYLYHYFMGLIIAFCLVPLAWQEAADRWPRLRAWLEPVMAAMTFLLLAGFIFYSPLTFHRPLTHAQCERRNFLQHVVNCR